MMRDFKNNMKRQRGRNRGGGGSSNGGGKPQQNANRAFDSNGPDNVKIRGHAQHVFEKYQQYARDAFSSGDRVLAENYLQHADHYFRVLRTIQPQRSPSEILGRDVLASGLDIDFEEEFEAGDEGAEVQAEAAMEANGGGDGRREERYEPRRDGDSQYRDRNDTRRDAYESRDRNTEPRQDRYGEGQARPRADGPQRDRNDNGSSRDRNDGGYSRDRTEGQGQGQYRDRQDGRDRNGERSERQDGSGPRRDNRSFEPRRDDRTYGREPRESRVEERRPDEPRNGEAAPAFDPLPMISPGGGAQPFAGSAPEAETSPVLRSEDGAMSEAPAFLQPVNGEDAELRKPRARRRRTPRSFEPADGGGEDGPSAAPSGETEGA